MSLWSRTLSTIEARIHRDFDRFADREVTLVLVPIEYCRKPRQLRVAAAISHACGPPSFQVEIAASPCDAPIGSPKKAVLAPRTPRLENLRATGAQVQHKAT
jgi:hypothetical protein